MTGWSNYTKRTGVIAMQGHQPSWNCVTWVDSDNKSVVKLTETVYSYAYLMQIKEHQDRWLPTRATWTLLVGTQQGVLDANELIFSWSDFVFCQTRLHRAWIKVGDLQPDIGPLLLLTPAGTGNIWHCMILTPAVSRNLGIKVSDVTLFRLCEQKERF